MAKNGKHSDSLSRRKMREENRLSRPKSKRSKKGKIHYSYIFMFNIFKDMNLLGSA